MDNKIFYWLPVIVFSLGQLLRFNFDYIVPGLRITGLDLLVAVYLIGLSLYFRHKRIPVRVSMSFYCLVGLWLVMMASLLVHLDGKSLKDIIVAIGYCLRFGSYISLAVLVSNLLGNKLAQGEKRDDCLVYGLVGLTALGIIQYLFFPNQTQLFYLGWDRHYYRLIGPLFDPNFTGLLIIFGLILVATKYIPKSHKSELIKLYILGLFWFVCLMLTFSRGSYLTFFIVSTIYLVLKKQLKWLVVIIGVSLLAIVLMPKPFGEGVNLLRTSTISARFTNYQEGWKLIRENPWGVGYNFLPSLRPENRHSWPPSHSQAGLDSSLLYTWATCGFAGFLILVVFFFSQISRIFKRSFIEYSLLAGLSTLALLIHSLFYNSFYYPHILLFYGLILALEETGD
jgi:hypothetical protein